MYFEKASVGAPLGAFLFCSTHQPSQSPDSEQDQKSAHARHDSFEPVILKAGVIPLDEIKHENKPKTGSKPHPEGKGSA